MTSRACAIQILHGIIADKHSLTQTMPAILATQSLKPADVSLVKALCFGVLRRYHWLDCMIQKLVTKPLKHKDVTVKIALLVGLYQLFEMRIPPHAAINETVNAVKQLGQNWAVKLVNGVLRRAQREQESLQQFADRHQRYSHPQWLMDAIKTAYPQQWQHILDANNQQAPLYIRVNQQKVSREDYQQLLNEQNIENKIAAVGQCALQIVHPIDVKDLPHFTDGWVSVQDIAAQQAVEWLAPQNGESILDACAAPGGKTGYLLEIAPEAKILALDDSSERLQQVRENVTRLHLSADCKVGDAMRQDWWNGELFDRILLDAPCSATGVIRRHPDIKLLRQPNDIPALAKQQLAMLQNLWPMLKPGGCLLYATCSILPEENDNVIGTFLSLQSDAQVDKKISAPCGQATQYGWQFLPQDQGPDGFYCGRLIKVLH